MAEMIFNKYDMSEVKVDDLSLGPYINLTPVSLPHSHGRQAHKQFGKMRVNIVERLVNKLMRGGTGEKTSGKVIRTHGKLQGKKSKAMKTVEEAFADIAKRTNQNPVQVLVLALKNTAPREDTTRVQYGGISYQVAVDVSPQRRLDMDLRNLALSAIMAAFNNPKTLGQALADEIVLASQNSINSYAIKKRDETERMARSTR
ncbi:30S ribosomal protein S7 [Candidatus Burarchaeum australiense]|nr:30S ribosomal protein S7 [Candidatus Burarchaeum australiense]